MSTTTNSSKSASKAPAKGSADAGAKAADDSAPKKKKSKLLIIILVLVLLVGSAGAAWYFFLRPHGDKEGTDKVAAKAVVKAPVFVPLDQFTVNLQREDSSAQYLQVGLSLKTSDGALVEAVKLHLPEIRNRVLLLLASKTASSISTSEGKKALVAELKHEITLPLGGDGHAPVLDDVLFTSFVIQ